MGVSLDEAISSIDAASSIPELTAILQRVAENSGFASYAFVDVSVVGDQEPLLIQTNRADWDRTYRSEKFLEHDPALDLARRTNVPFDWSSLPLPERRGKRIPGALKTLFAARDHGYRNGVVIPFHYVDRIGRKYSSVCTFFWTDPLDSFIKGFKLNKTYLHMVMIYWAQKVVDMTAATRQLPHRFLDAQGNPLLHVELTDREREVLTWAAKGKTSAEVAAILNISENTVAVHTKHAITKLGAATKTEACVRSIYLCLINP
jgi:DNA-binding CsgD family transcriptional regulator